MRSSTATQSSNVITELPRGYPVEVISSLDPFKKVNVWDCMDTISGYVLRDYLTAAKMSCADDDMWVARYSISSWKRKSHSGKYYLPVKRIQQDLYNIGYTQVGTADGYFGTNTETAVKAFQSANGLTADGIFGIISKKPLWELIDRRG